MDPDKFQQAWKADDAQKHVTIDSDLLLKVVQRNQREFRATIDRRDLREVAVALLLLPVWMYLGRVMETPWTWYLMVPALIWVAGYIVVYAMRRNREPIESGASLLKCVDSSLIEVEDQIWLLRNIFWWYLLPSAVPVVIVTAHAARLRARNWWNALLDINSLVFVLLLAIYYFLYYVNQRCVDRELKPRRQELLTLRNSLEDESVGERRTTDRTEKNKRPGKLGRRLVIAISCIATLVVLSLASGIFDSEYDQPPQSNGPVSEALAEMVTDLRKEKNLVGLAAMVMVDGHVQAAAAHGERKYGRGVAVETGDRWHTGGITKSISATMIARLVESGQMAWTDTLGETYSDDSIHEDWKSVTVKQLLTDTAGAPANFSLLVRLRNPAFGSECAHARRAAVLGVLKNPPIHPPGEKFAYSNVGVTVACAMAEEATGKAWKDLVIQEVFEPLELAESGFGPPKSPEETLDQPQGHREFLRGKIAVGDDADNTTIMGPSGIIHMTLNDLCTFATEHLRGELDKGKLLSAGTYELLHTPELDRYAFGWVKKEATDETPYTTYWHNGSNTMWYSMVVFVPEKNTVVAVTSNDGDIENAQAAAWEIIEASMADNFE